MSFIGKRFTIWTDETSGIGGRARPSTYGVYDNKKNSIHYIKDWNASNYEEAHEKATELNKLEDKKKELKNPKN